MITLIDFGFLKLRPLKTWSEKCLKCPFLEDPSRSNMVAVQSTVVVSIIAHLAY